MALEELDTVALTVDLTNPRLTRGCVGTVVCVLSPEQVEVEFVDNDGRTYGLTAVRTDQLLPLRHSPDVHAGMNQ